MIVLPNGAATILSALEQHGFQAYIVGGCVRDSCCGICPNDWDICTNATPAQVKSCFPTVKIIETGIKHGTLTLLLDTPYEVTTYRVDGAYLDNRRPNEVTFVNSIQQDLSRRDFTINAMAYNPRTGLLDCFHGKDDLQNKCIRCVGEPNLRFNEDALRILRALRFASVFDFTIEESTAQAMHANQNLLTHISAERIRVELCKLLCGKGVERILIDYASVLTVFLPEIAPLIGFAQNNPHHTLDVWQHTAKSVACAPPDPALRLALLFHDITKPSCYAPDEQGVGHFPRHPYYSAQMALTILKRLTFDTQTMEQVQELILYHDTQILPESRFLKRWMNKIGTARLRQLLQVKAADNLAKAPQYQNPQELEMAFACIDRILEQQQCFSRKDLAVNGDDLIALGIPKGAQIGIMLNRLLDLVLEEKLPNQREQLLHFARHRNPRQ